MEQTTKVVSGLSEFKEDKKPDKGLLQRIKEAKSESEVEYLLNVGKSYKKVSVGTMKKWVKAATKRSVDLHMERL